MLIPAPGLAHRDVAVTTITVLELQDAPQLPAQEVQGEVAVSIERDAQRATKLSAIHQYCLAEKFPQAVGVLDPG